MELITLDQLKIIQEADLTNRLENHASQRNGLQSATAYYKIFDYVLSSDDAYNHNGIVFAVSSRHNGSGIMVMNFACPGNFNEARGSVAFYMHSNSRNDTFQRHLSFFYNKANRTITCYQNAYDYDNISVDVINSYRWLHSSKGSITFYNEENGKVSALPTGQEEFEYFTCAFKETNRIATREQVASVFTGGGLKCRLSSILNNLFRKKEVIYGW